MDLTPIELEIMKNHKYQSTGYTTIDNLMNPFWIKCASYLPYSYSPNMVTVTGLFCQFLAIIVIATQDWTISQPLSPFVYIFCAFMIFLAQTFDAIDGKHARNTNRASSLGQLMDHGCDSMDNFLFCLMLAQAHLIGSTVSTLLLQIGIQFPFYAYTLEEHFSGVLRTQMNNVGVTEIQFFSMFLLIFPAIFGHSISLMNIFGFRLVDLAVYAFVLYGLYQVIVLVYVSSDDGINPMDKFKYLDNMLLLIVTELLSSKLNLFLNKAYFVILLNGFYFALFTCKLIIGNMAKRSMDILDIDICVYSLGIFIAVFIGGESIIIILLIGWLVYRFYTQVIYAIFKMLDYLQISF